MRASRLLSILMLLQTRGRMSAPALAIQLEVSQRTILRDMDHLSAAGVPVWSDRGREGGFQLRDGWSTHLTGLTDAEAQALFLGGLPVAATHLGLGAAAASAQLKMVSALPAALRADAMRTVSRLHVDPVDWYRSGAPPAHLQAVAEAVWKQRTVEMQYESWAGIRVRTAMPLGLVLKAGTWYMVAGQDAADEPRIYRLSAIRTLTVSTAAFKRPRGFELGAFWQQAAQRFENGLHRGEAHLRATSRGLKLLRQLGHRIDESVARTAQPDPDDAHWSRVAIPIESVAHAANQLLGLGTDVEVLRPAALRDLMRQTIQAMAAAYA